MKKILLSTTTLIVFTFVYILFVFNVIQHWAKLTGEYTFTQIIGATIFYGCLYIVLAVIRHNYIIKNKTDNTNSIPPH